MSEIVTSKIWASGVFTQKINGTAEMNKNSTFTDYSEAMSKGQQHQEGITVTRKDNFSEWYIQVLTKAELIEYGDVSGCYTLRPNSFALWEAVTAHLDGLIKKDGVKNAYFPCFVSSKSLTAEADNFEGFCPEVQSYPFNV